MKRIFYSLLAVLPLVCGCKAETPEPENGTPVDTRYTVSFDGVAFAKGDMLSLLNSNYKGALTAETSGESVLFSGKAPKLPSSDHYLAVYPHSDAYELKGRTVQFSLPSVVTPEVGRTTGALGVGYSQDESIVLHPVTAYLKFTVSREDIVSMVFRYGLNNEGAKAYIAGTLKVTMGSNGMPSVAIQNGVEALSITDRILPGTYKIAVAPEKYDLIFIDVTTSEGTDRVTVSQSGKLTEGDTKDLGTVDKDLNFEIPSDLPSLELVKTSASTAAVTWSATGFNDVYADISQKWSAGIYNDPDCNDLRVSWDFPVALWNVYDGTTITSLEGPYSPRFIFTSLEASTDYYIKVWLTDHPTCVSKPLKVTTAASAFVTLPDTYAKEGSVILQEDFEELPLGGDIASRCFGFSDKNKASAPAFDAPSGANPGKQTIRGFEHNWYLVYPGLEIGLFNTLRGAISGTRLNAWTSISEDNTDGKVLAKPGYIKLGASDKTGGIVTPALNCLEHKAVVKLSFKAHPYRESVNDPLTASVLLLNTSQTNASVLTDYTVVSKKDFSIGENHEWKEFSFELTVPSGCRLAISSRRASGSGQRRILVDDVKVELIEYIIQTKVSEIKTPQNLIDFLAASDTYEAGEFVTLANDLDLSGVTLPTASSFLGVFDGAGHSLKNWNNDGHSLFAALGKEDGAEGNGTVKNLVLDASCKLSASLSTNFGLIAGVVNSSGVIDGVIVNGAVQPLTVSTLAASRLGTVAGVSYGLIQNCVNNAAISITTSEATDNVYFGGIVGFINSSGRLGLYNNTNNGDISYRVNGKGKLVYMGGVSAGTSTRKLSEASDSRGIVDRCVNTGNISYYLTNGGSMEDNAGTIGSGNYIKLGGVVGYFEGDVTNCTNGVSGSTTKGTVSATVPTNMSGSCTTGPSIGGVAAFVLRNVTGCTNYGKVYVKGTFAGGTTDAQGVGVNANFCAGGVVAQAGPSTGGASYSVSDCHNYGELDINSWMATVNGTGMYFGGIAGWLNLPVSQCVNEGTIKIVTKGAANYAGGIYGQGAFAADHLTNKGEVNVTLERDNSDTANKQCASSYHRIGGIVGYSNIGLSESTNYGKIVVKGSSQTGVYCPLVGGVAGQAGAAFATSNNEGDIEVDFPADGTNGLRVGGVVGHLGGISVTDVYSKGGISVSAGTLASNLVVGGVIGWKAGAAVLSNLSSTEAAKPILVQVSEMNSQFFVGGVVGRFENETANTYSGLKNYKPLSVIVGTSTSGGYSYLGGVAACDKGGQTFTSNENYGNVSYTGPQKMRVGGITSYSNQGISGNKAQCDISVKATGTDFSEVGGVIAYTAATAFSDNRFSGNIDTSESAAKVYTGGLLGKSNGNQAFNGCTFSGTLKSATGNNVPGLYVGGVHSNDLKMTFGDNAKCTVGAGSKVNGAAVTELKLENLVSQSSNDGTFTSSATLTNISIE